MLTGIDEILMIFFGYIVPIIIFLYGICVALYALCYCLAELPGTPAFIKIYTKIDMFGIALFNSVCIYWFFIWRSDIALHSKIYQPHIDTTIAMLFMIIVMAIPMFLRCIFIPLWISGIIYLGIAIFGI